MSAAAPRTLLLVGATGHLGRQVLQAARDQGRRVRVLLRPGSRLDAGADVEVVSGDLLDPPSLARACAGVDAIVDTAIGYSGRRRADRAAATDRDGQFHLIDAARAAGVRRFVFNSVLTCDRAPQVPHFHDKALVERHLAASGLDHISLRPGAFVDQAKDFWIDGLKRGRLDVLGNPDVAWSYVHTADLARYLLAAVDLPADPPGVVDIGCDRAVSMREVARIFAAELGRPVALRTVPWPLASALLRVLALRDSWQDDFRRMFGYILEGGYVADTTLQRRLFGDVPTIESALARYAAAAGLTRPGALHG